MKLSCPAFFAGLLVLSEVSSPAQVGIPRPDHVVIVIEENHAYSAIIGSSSAPYINSLAAQGALFTESFAISHPSQPNYLALFSGSTQGITSDSCPHYFGASNLGSELFAAGYTFAGYSESMPTDSFIGCGSGGYARKHNPWVNFTNVPSAANLTLASFPTDFSALPTVSFVIPNLGNDMHNGSVRAGDSWLQSHLDAYVQWARTNNSLLIVTWDEDDRSENNHIATLFIGPMVQPGQYSGRINHYTILRTLEDMFGLPYAGESATAAPILNVWTTGGAGLIAELTSPANGAVFGEPASVALVASAASAGGNVQKVEFFAGVTKLGERTSPPFAVTWTNVPGGHYELNVKVTDDHGAMKSSAPIEVTVLSGAQLLARMQGTYNGLFYETIHPAHASSGFVTLTTTAKGQFTGKLTAGSGSYAMNGQFDGSGSWSNTVTSRGSTPLAVQLSVDLLNQPDQIHGTVSDGTWIAQLLADQSVFNAKTRPAPQAGKYTFLIPGNDDAAQFPGGDGYATVSVDAGGRIKASGNLGDGTAINQSSVLAKDGRLPFYVALYGGRGSIFGWLTVTNAGTALQNAAYWFKGASSTNQPDKFYPQGFAQTVAVLGSPFVPPAASAPLFDWNTGVATLGGGNLAGVVTNHVTLGSNNRLTVVDPGPSKLTLTVNLSAGSLNGSFMHPQTGKSASIKGVVLQSMNAAGGYFLGTNQSGRVLLQQNP